MAVLLILINLIESIFLRFSHRKREAISTRISATTVGVIAGLVGVMHSWGEFSHRDLKLTGFMFEANTGRSLINVPTSHWTGWIAMTLVPNFLITSFLSIIMSFAIVVWSLFFIRREKGGLVLVFLSAVAILLGCGFIPPFLGIIAGVIGSRIKHHNNKVAV